MSPVLAVVPELAGAESVLGAALELELLLGAALEPVLDWPDVPGVALEDELAPALGESFLSASADPEVEAEGVDDELELELGVEGVAEELGELDEDGGVLVPAEDEDEDGAVGEEEDGAVGEDEDGAVGEDEDGADGAGAVVLEDDEPADGVGVRALGPSVPLSQP